MSSSNTSSVPEVKGMIIEQIGHALWITLARPRSKNALNGDLYDGIAEALNYGANEDSVYVAVLTGQGDYYSSGNDLRNFSSTPTGSPEEMSRNAGVRLTSFVSAFIDFPKPLVAAVNGPAIGIAVTSLTLCDFVYASETATFTTPFAKLGQSPEGLSSFTFPSSMGWSKAMEMLLMGKTVDAKEACERNLVTQVFSKDTFRQEIQKRVDTLTSLPPKTMQHIKNVVRHNYFQGIGGTGNDQMKALNKREVALLERLWVSEECMQAIMNFFMEAQAKRKAKKKARLQSKL
jgi:Delta3-Delta2-enoyl-CoA isomerase